MAVNLSLLLENAQVAIANGQIQHGLFLLKHAMKLADEHHSSSHSSLDAAIGLDRGLVREVNEDCILALQGTLPDTQDMFGLFVVCDGVGGHVYGLEAAHLASQTIMESVFPHLLGEKGFHERWEDVLVEGVHLANRAIYLRNRSTLTAQTMQPNPMGTTVTAVLLIADTAYIVNVGDSRTYLYRSLAGLVRVTQDHSVVADIFHLSDQRTTPEELYTHPKRNQITRSLGVEPSVEVDTFVEVLQADDILLLCSDGLWEMTRDPKMQSILALDWASAEYMAQRLLRLAKEGGGKDNIGLLVAQISGRQRRGDVSNISTVLSPTQGLARIVPAAS